MFAVPNRALRAIMTRTVVLSRVNMSTLKTTLTNQDLYAAESSKVLKTIEDRFMEDDLDLDFDNTISSSSDVLNLQTQFGTWVLNKHNVTKQIWQSSPRSGPSKYNYHIPEGTNELSSPLNALQGGRWLNERDDSGSLHDLLTNEFSTVFNKDVQFEHKF